MKRELDCIQKGIKTARSTYFLDSNTTLGIYLIQWLN